ncbi:MAG: DUF2924 domain-containing protein [Hyphomicrobium sp.]
MASNTKLYERLRALETSSRVELVAEWNRVFKSAPPRYASPKFMAQGIAYALQERAFGGLSLAIQRQLSSIANGKPVQATSEKIKPGTRLLREWHGTTHEVMATDKGYVWNGTTYRSLTAIARTITGTQWNGLVFFGLKKKLGAKDG